MKKRILKCLFVFPAVALILLGSVVFPVDASASEDFTIDPGWYLISPPDASFVGSMLPVFEYVIYFSLGFDVDLSAYSPDTLFHAPALCWATLAELTVRSAGSWAIEWPDCYSGCISNQDAYKVVTRNEYLWILVSDFVTLDDPDDIAIWSSVATRWEDAAVEKDGFYSSLYNMISNAFYGEDAVLTGWQDMVLTVLATVALVFCFAVPFIVIWLVLRLVVGSWR